MESPRKDCEHLGSRQVGGAVGWGGSALALLTVNRKGLSRKFKAAISLH